MTNEKTRGFEVAKGFEDKGIELPERATKNSAGYDFKAAEDIVIPSIWKTLLTHLLPNKEIPSPGIMKPTLVSTGVKSYMKDNEYLLLVNRSSGPLKSLLALANGVGVVDSDYYSNPDNDGHIMFQFINFGITDKQIKKGDRIGQGIFKTFLKADADNAQGERQGGHGHTGTK